MKRQFIFVAVSVWLAACQKTDIEVGDAAQPPQSVSAPAAKVLPQPAVSQKLLKERLTVNRDANCGCCHQWMEHAKAGNLHVEDVVLPSHAEVVEIKDRYVIAPEMRSCHTVVSGSGYVFEGHVPLKSMAEFLDNPPQNAIGLAVPGMPVGSIGMENGEHFMPYEVMLLKKDGTYEVFAKIEQPADQY